ncbi:MAG: polysaccharide deacetylase family protein [Solirubrobacteraceae bacterium]
MSDRALILVYHAIEPGPPPLCIPPEVFREHLDCLARAEARVVTLAALVDDIQAGRALGTCVAITFDDGFQSVVDHAAPLLAERGLPATMFCVAGHLGAHNDWATQPARVPVRPLASARSLATAAVRGFALGSHGMSHTPLAGAPASVLERELADSRAVLEAVTGAPVRWFAYPYGVIPSAAGGAAVAQTYDAACAAAPRPVHSGADLFALPRVDAHYLRRPSLFRAVLRGLDSYLHIRRAAARVRRVGRRDFRRST